MDIKKARESAALSQQKMSDLTGIPLRTIQSWEIGERKPPEWQQRLVIKELEELKIKKYAVVDDRIEFGGADIFCDWFGALEEANAEAEAQWDHFTDMEKKKRHIYVAYKFAEPGEYSDHDMPDGGFDSNNLI